MTIVQRRSFAPLLLIALFFALAGCNRGENTYESPPPPEVTVARPVERSITPFLEERGAIEAVDEADVRARVRGFVEKIEFEPGQDVTEGDILYRIESDQYDAAVNSAKAAVSAAEANIGVANAMVATSEAEIENTAQNRRREKELFERNAGSQADLDAAIAQDEMARAALDSAKANVETAIAEKEKTEAALANAELDLGYCDVRSPISGRISITDVKVGNLVDNGGKLAAVVNHEQVYANFSISDRAMLRFVKQKRAELKPGEELKEVVWNKVPVFLRRETDDVFEFEGVLNYVDQEGVDADTGTLGLRGKFDNQEHQLFPGLFVSIRMPTGVPAPAMLIPEYTVLRDQRGLYVLTVNSERKVERVTVTVARSIAGWSVIESGLTPNTQVVVDGLQRARPGLVVDATEKQLQVDDAQLLRGTSLRGDFLETDADTDTGSEQPAADPEPSADE